MRPKLAGKIVIFALFLAALYAAWTRVPPRYRRIDGPGMSINMMAPPWVRATVVGRY